MATANIRTPTARERLTARPKPYFFHMDQGLSLGYRKNKAGGKWVLRWYSGDGEYQVETLGRADDGPGETADGEAVMTFSQAQQKARNVWQLRQMEAEGRDARVGPYTVSDALDDYHRHLDKRGKTATDSLLRSNALIVPDLGEIRLDKLTTQQIRKWHEGIASSPARLRSREGDPVRHRTDGGGERPRKATANRMLTILKASLNHAFREGRIGIDSAWRRVKPFERADMARVRYLQIDEAQRLLNASDSDLRSLIQAALLTGMRYGELAALQCRDFDLAARAVHVADSKSGKPRYVYLNDAGIALFDQLVAGKTGNELVFRKADGSSWGRSHQVRPLKQACKVARIEPAASFHILRHTYASLSIMRGAPLNVVSANLGHADTRMTEKHYGHLARGYVQDLIAKSVPSFDVDDTNVVNLRSSGQ